MKNMESFKTLETNKEIYKYDTKNLTSEHIEEIDLILAKASNDIDEIRRKTYYNLLNVRKKDGTTEKELIHVDLIKEFYKLEPIETVAREYNPDIEIVYDTIKWIHICLVDDETMDLIKKVKENK